MLDCLILAVWLTVHSIDGFVPICVKEETVVKPSELSPIIQDFYKGWEVIRYPDYVAYAVGIDLDKLSPLFKESYQQGFEDGQAAILQHLGWVKAEWTFYDPLDPAQTGKGPGDPGYGIGASGKKVAIGDVAVHPPDEKTGRPAYLPFDTVIEIYSPKKQELYPWRLTVNDYGDPNNEKPWDWLDIALPTREMGEDVMRDYGTEVWYRIVERR